MARQHPLYLIFQWHMHQPYYIDRIDKQYKLPWVRLHAVKDYTDMAWHLERHPDIRGVINFVPSLLRQLEAYSEFEQIDERHLALTIKDPAKFTDSEKRFVLQEFFSSNHHRMIQPSPRYQELYEMRSTDSEEVAISAALERFSVQDFVDLQVWFLLAWTGEELRSTEMISRLMVQGRDFTEADKFQILEIHKEAIRGLRDRYTRLEDSNQIEISVSPYTHPILPLLLDTEIARISMPGAHLPLHRFRYPGEAEDQVTKALRMTREEYDWEVHGMWPSEGSVSEEAVELIARHQVQWISTDSQVLARSLSRSAEPTHLTNEMLYQPYAIQTKSGDMAVFFRDQQLSDLIGFRYAGMNPDEAAADFISHLNRIDSQLPDDNFPYVAVVTMDGENAWEHYERNGKPFFDALYQRLTQSQRIITTTFADYLARFGTKKKLEWLHPGSWIGADFHIWIGHPEKNAAWDALNDALKTAQHYRKKNDALPDGVEEALSQAEGSDWFWWYGDHNNSEHDPVFDSLFCSALRFVYQQLDVPVPTFLEQSDKNQGKKRG